MLDAFFKMRLHEVRLLRRIVLPFLSRFNLGDVTIRHHYTNEPIRLHSFRHKGYWYHGREREHETMELFARLIHRGDSVLEVGGHIGYMTLWFKRLAGAGRVIVFEPGANNLPYIRQNVSGRGIELVEKAAGDKNGTAPLYLESLSGQNNSLITEFKGLEMNRGVAFVEVEVTRAEVETVRLDDYSIEADFTPDFVKIDVEGYEWNVLLGMTGLLKQSPPALMVEVQANHKQVFELFMDAKYVLFDPALKPLRNCAELNGNVFCLHSARHRAQLHSFGILHA